jgi:cyclopropane fatty-acyl-phospholipid synthase-like methyltransferase
MYRGDDLTLLNVGYAADVNVSTSGILDTLDKASRQAFDKYRIQLYHKIVLENGNIESMEGKTLLETGVGRGGGLNYLAQALKPQYAIGIDMTLSQVSLEDS